MTALYVGGKIGGDKEYPFSGVTNSGRVWREGARKPNLGDKEYPFSGVTNSGRVWRKVPDNKSWR